MNQIAARRCSTIMRALAAVVLIVCSACSPHHEVARPTPTPPPDWITYHEVFNKPEELTFRHPKEWRVFVWRHAFHYEFPIAYIGNTKYRIAGGGGTQPCTITPSITNCGVVWDDLPSPGITIDFEKDNFPRPPDYFAVIRGREVTVGGFPAKVGEDSSVCRDHPTYKGFSVELKATPEDFFGLTVCIRGPGIERTERTFWVMLNSVSFRGLTRT